MTREEALAAMDKALDDLRAAKVEAKRLVKNASRRYEAARDRFIAATLPLEQKTEKE